MSSNSPNRLLLTRAFPLPSNPWDKLFSPLMLAGTKIWNSCVWESRHAHEEEGRWPSEGELKAKLKENASWKQLHSQSAQAVVEEYFEAVKAYIRHKENGHTEQRPPGFKPKTTLRTITWKRQGFELNGNQLILKLSRGNAPIVVPVPAHHAIINLPGNTTFSGTPVEVKVKAVFRRKKLTGFQLHITYDYGEVPLLEEGNIATHDLNAALVAKTISDGSQYLFNCRELLALIQYRNKIQAEFQEKMSRCKEGSRRWRKLLVAKTRVLAKLERRINQMEHALTKVLADLDVKHNVSVSVVGDLIDLRRSARTGMKNKAANQKINQLPYDRFKKLYAYKSLMRCIEPKTHSERYTSSTCAKCGKHNPKWRKHRGLWSCQECGFTIQADLNGSANLQKNYVFGDCRDKSLPFPLKPPVTYRWDKRRNQFIQVSPIAA